MKIRKTFFYGFAFFYGLLSFSVVKAQTECKVLKKEISDTYEGDCKKGMAHGIGIAKGIDTYEGRFKKGLPHGEGTYVYSDGSVYKGMFRKGLRNGNGKYEFVCEGNDSIQEGIWKEDTYIGKKPEKPYKVTLNKQINRYSFIKTSDAGNIIKVTIKLDGNNIVPQDIILVGSSGVTKTSLSFNGFENVNFPFEGTIRFEMSNAMSINVYECEMQFEIKEPGSWEIILNN